MAIQYKPPTKNPSPKRNPRISAFHEVAVILRRCAKIASAKIAGHKNNGANVVANNSPSIKQKALGWRTNLAYIVIIHSLDYRFKAKA